jgi:hypothetical protein
MDPVGNGPASFSNFLQDSSSDDDKARVISAPGVSIKSTTSYARDAAGYRVLSGTSQVCENCSYRVDVLHGIDCCVVFVVTLHCS